MLSLTEFPNSKFTHLQTRTVGVSTNDTEAISSGILPTNSKGNQGGFIPCKEALKYLHTNAERVMQ